MVNYKELIDKAIHAREGSYSPYSHFSVGAALLSDDGEIFLGCNIENSAYSETICAERVALYNAVSSKKRGFVALAIVGGKTQIDSFTYPCGACRQALSEFCSKELEIVLFDGESIQVTTLGSLLPQAFSPKDLS